MSFTDYTDVDTIRGLLGANEIEVPDAIISLPAYSTVIDEGLDALNSNIVDMYETVEAIPSGDRTKPQTRFLAQVELYAAHLMASALVSKLPMLAPKKISDSKAELERVNDPYTMLAENLLNTLATLGGRILTTLGVLDPALVPVATARVRVSAVDLGVDPVTGA